MSVLSDQKEPDDTILVRGKLRRAVRRREAEIQKPVVKPDRRSTVIHKGDDHAPFPNFRGFNAVFGEVRSFISHEPFFGNAH